MINKYLLEDEEQEIYTGAFEDENKKCTKNIVIGFFHEKNGPTIACTTLEGNLKNYEQKLFPSKWKEDSIFITKKNQYYILGICCFAPLIKHQRGCYQLSICIFSDHYSFSENDFKFLRESKTCMQQKTKIEIKDFTAIASSLGIPIGCKHTSSFNLSSYPFLKYGIITRMINKAEDLFIIWKARMLGLKIIIGLTNDLYDSTSISFFVGAISTLNDCGFSAEWYDIDNMEQEQLNVISFTLPYHQIPTHGDIFIGKLDPKDKHFVQIRNQNYSFLRKGGGTILNTISQHAYSDMELLRCLRSLSQSFYSILERSAITNNDLTSIGLNSSNAHFVELYIKRNHLKTNTDNLGSQYCC